MRYSLSYPFTHYWFTICRHNWKMSRESDISHLRTFTGQLQGKANTIGESQSKTIWPEKSSGTSPWTERIWKGGNRIISERQKMLSCRNRTCMRDLRERGAIYARFYRRWERTDSENQFYTDRRMSKICMGQDERKGSSHSRQIPFVQVQTCRTFSNKRLFEDSVD